ncbi:MAG: hypothetical protein R3B52_03500 [Candidatus Paceibacterota bacterium]
MNETLVAAAQLKANDMAARGYFAHNTPEGFEPWYFSNRLATITSTQGKIWR